MAKTKKNKKRISKKNKSIKLKKNEVRLKILAIGLNYVDTLMIKGDYQYKNKLPFFDPINEFIVNTLKGEFVGSMYFRWTDNNKLRNLYVWKKI